MKYTVKYTYIHRKKNASILWKNSVLLSDCNNKIFNLEPTCQ